LHEVNLYFGFALLLALYATVTGIAIVMTASGMAWFGVPRWIVRTVAVLMATILTGWITLGLGWFINLSAGATYFAMLLGFLFGAWVLGVESVRRVSGV
jgi:hypothetical protein